MLNEKAIFDALKDIPVPGVHRDVVSMNLIQGVEIKEKLVNITVASTALDEQAQNWIKEKAIQTLKSIDPDADPRVTFVEKRAVELNKVKNIVAIMSGKGGVGKSLVAGLTAVILSRNGYSVGILDADITGPSIPKMFGITVCPSGNESGILPVRSANGIEIISINLFLPSTEEAVIWRGPLVGKAITQFWEDVLWGSLDYLIVDLPPGTSDAPLTALQVLPVTGAIVVFTPQDLSTMIVKKAVKMAQQMDKKVLGVVENMSYLYIPELKKKMEIFGKSKGEEMAQSSGAPLLARIPIDPELAKLCDEGHIERYNADILQSYRDNLLKLFAPK